jgi:F-type H+-transporting ATPase subunit b
MPQLDASTFLPQLVWLAITFAVLCVLMIRIGLPPVGAVLEKRRTKIDGDLDKAQQLKNEADAVMAAYERALAEARASAQEILRQATERMTAEAEKRRRETAAALQREAASAEEGIAAARNAALADVRGAAGDVARQIAEKLSGTGVGLDEANVAVNGVMSEPA